MKNILKTYLHFAVLALIAALVIGLSSKDKDNPQLNRYYEVMHEKPAGTTDFKKLVERSK